MDRRLKQVLAFVILGGVIFSIAYVGLGLHEAQYEEVTAVRQRITYYSLGWHPQGDVVEARVIVDEGSVKVLEGRAVTLVLLDSGNKASAEREQGYVPLEEVVIDTDRTDVGEVSYTAHAGDTYYLAYRNEDLWDMKLRVADGDALWTQQLIRASAVCLVVASLVIFSWAYGLMMGMSVRRALGLARRRRGLGPAGGP